MRSCHSDAPLLIPLVFHVGPDLWGPNEPPLWSDAEGVDKLPGE